MFLQKGIPGRFTAKSGIRELFLEHDLALKKVMVELLSDHTELFKQFMENPSFKKWLSETIFSVTYEQAG